MINKRDVLTLKIPFPNISSTLAVKAHMYICQRHVGNQHSFVKCQTKKPYMIGANPIKNYLQEFPNIHRSPFQHITIIDCDKLFSSLYVQYDDSLKTTSRPDVCVDIMNKVDALLALQEHIVISINESDLVSINYSVSYI